MPMVRHDPVPPLAPIPDVQHVVLVDSIPAEYGGRTASILMKCRTLYERAGIRTIIVTRQHSPFLGKAIESMRERGQLSDGVEVRSLVRSYPDASEAPAPVRHQVQIDGLHELKTSVASGSAYRYFDAQGRYVSYRRFDDAGCLVLQDTFDRNRKRVSREEFSDQGHPSRTSYWGEDSSSPIEHIYFRRDGSPMFAHRLAPPVKVSGWSKDEGLVFFDEEGRPERESHGSYAPVVEACLDELVGDRPTVLSVEARFVDRDVMDYQRPNVRSVFVLHSSHLEPPGLDVTKVRGSFRGLFSHADDGAPIVFLTATQRAEAEALLGKHENFRVIPHASPAPASGASVGRDPNLVIMMGRLSAEKRVGDSITAFAKVLQAQPQARLEIFGDGPEKSSLRRLITSLGVGHAVQLKGFTTDPGGEYQRAALCLLTSTFEGAPMVLIEALRHGCPVISYDIRYGPADIIEDGVNGYLIPSGDVDALARKIAGVLGDPVLAASLEQGCAVADERFGEDAFLARWIDLFHRLAMEMTTA